MSNKTAAMILQELAIKKTGSPPVYNTIANVQGTHENEFVCEVEVMGIEASAKGRSKKEAKQEAARNALNLLNEKVFLGNEEIPPNIPLKPPEDTELKQVVNYIGVLGDACQMYNIQPPEYLEISAVGPPHAMEFTYECHLGSTMKTRATANTKKNARQIVAREMYERIKNIAPMDILKEQENECLKLCDKDARAMDCYNDLSFMKKLNLGIKIRDYNYTLKNVMDEKAIQYDDLKMYLDDPISEFKLATFLEKLELEYSYENLTRENDEFHTYVLNVTMDSPLCSIGQASQEEEAKSEALLKMFEMIREFIR